MSGHRVKDVMIPEVVVVTPDCGFKHIVDVLADFKVSAVPVVDDGTVVGIVSEADLLHKVEFGGAVEHARRFERRARRTARAKAAGETARDLMSSPVVTVGPDASIGAAARLMEQHHVKRLPVVDETTGRLVGVVARRDLLRRYLRPDADIRREIVEEVLLRTLWIDPTDIAVSVTEGRVTLGGRPDRRSTAQIAVRLARGVDGVVSVTDHLSWRFDDESSGGGQPIFDPEQARLT
jgi:CBS domain-containing protein